MLKIYGIPRSRAFRTLWMAKELGIEYENVPIDMGKGETRTPEYLAINPNGHIPAIDDDGFVLWESMAINLYLARRYDKGFGHFTTRTNMQFHWMKLEHVPDALDDLAKVQLHGIQTSGNSLRNVTAAADASLPSAAVNTWAIGSTRDVSNAFSFST